MKILSTIKKKVDQLLDDKSLFQVKTVISGSSKAPGITIIIDGDQGVTIDDCSRLNRKLANAIDNLGLFNDYSLTVSSPGLDHPLKLKRQYVKNLGRDVKIVTSDNQTIKGTLASVNDKVHVILMEGKQDKNITLNFKNIKKTFVMASLKK